MHQKYVLKNGLRIVAENIPSVHSAVIGIWIKSGSRYEVDTNRGVSHFIEHLLFKGTANRTAKNIAEELEALGGSLNAFTSKEYTCLYARVLAEHLPIAIELLSDMLLNSNFSEEDIEKERNVILEEIKMYEDTPDEYIHDLFVANLWREHPLGYPVLGTAETINKINKETIMDYYSKHYSPGKTVISVAGKIDYDDLFATLEKVFASWKSIKADSKQIAPPVPLIEDNFHLKKTEQVHFCIGTPGISQLDERIYTMSVLNNAIGGGLSSRLFQTIREERGLVYSIFSYNSSYTDAGLFSIYAGTRYLSAAEVLGLIFQELKKIKSEGITKEELTRIQTQIKGNILLSSESVGNRMIRLGRSEINFNRIITGEEIVEKTNKVTLEDVQSLANALFKKENFSLTSLGPERPAIDRSLLLD